MPQPLCTGATLLCTMGVAPSVFVATPRPGVPMIFGAMSVATIDQIIPFINVLPFGMCHSLANPAVASATAAALGVLTPMPCTPVIASPWAPPAVESLGLGLPVATVMSKCMCSFGGMISVTAPVPGPTQIL